MKSISAEQQKVWTFLSEKFKILYEEFLMEFANEDNLLTELHASVFETFLFEKLLGSLQSIADPMKYSSSLLMYGNKFNQYAQTSMIIGENVKKMMKSGSLDKNFENIKNELEKILGKELEENVLMKDIPKKTNTDLN